MITVNDVRCDWKVLDGMILSDLDVLNIVCYDNFTSKKKYNVTLLKYKLNFLKKIRLHHLFYIINAFQILSIASSGKVALVNGSEILWFYVGLINIFYRRKVICWDIFVEVDKLWKRKVFALALNNLLVSIVWSKKQVKTHASYFNISENKFIFLPYKANHSKSKGYHYPTLNYIFSGGNGKRDYDCLIKAVTETDIPVIISTTDINVKKSIREIDNIMIVAAYEPSFAKLQAMSRFIVVPMQHTGLKGGGEANFCNAMWHKKPIIAVDSIAAEDYIINGVTGFTIKSGDWKMLRNKIFELWNDPIRCNTMGSSGKFHVDNYFTHEKFIERLMKFSVLMKKGHD